VLQLAQGLAPKSVRHDATLPQISFAGARSYRVDEMVQIGCAAPDAMSGITSSTCATIAGSAYTFYVGMNAISASAEDRAGNVATASDAFVVTVSSASLCTLVRNWVPKEGIETSLCAKLSAAQRALDRGDLTARAGEADAFVNEVRAQTGKAVPADRAPTLIALFGRCSWRLLADLPPLRCTEHIMAISDISVGWNVAMLDAQSDDGLRREIIDGELHVTPAPSLAHLPSPATPAAPATVPSLPLSDGRRIVRGPPMPASISHGPLSTGLRLQHRFWRGLDR
jgi:hypothetical protein